MISEDEELQRANEPSVEFLLLADRAEAINGKLYLMGGAWDQLTLPSLDGAIFISLAVAIRVPWYATNRQYTLSVTVEDDDKNLLGTRAQAGFSVGRSALAIPGQPQRVLLAVPMLPIQFPRYGVYIVSANVPETEAASTRVPLRVINPADPTLGLPKGTHD